MSVGSVMGKYDAMCGMCCKSFLISHKGSKKTLYKGENRQELSYIPIE